MSQEPTRMRFVAESSFLETCTVNMKALESVHKKILKTNFQIGVLGVHLTRNV